MTARRGRRSQPPPEPAPAGRLSVTQAAQAVAAALIYATLYFLFAALPISAVPLTPSLALSVQPAVVVPVFVGLVGGPLMGAVVGFGGRLLGDLLAGLGVNGYGLAHSAVLGLVAGLGYGRLDGFRTLRHLAIAFAVAWLACAAASLVSVLLLQTWLWHELQPQAGLNQALSQLLSGGLLAMLLISTPLYLWGLRHRR
jgi:hypothetical protein